MPDAPVSPDTLHLEMISAMTQCAFELGMVAGEVAKRAGHDTALFLKATAEFQRCFFAVRMGIRLSHWGLAGTSAARTASRAEPAELEQLETAEPPERPEAPERAERAEAPDRVEREAERDRDYEPVSLPQFLKSLGLVAASAERRQGDLPPHIRDTTLPTLRNLLREANAPPGGTGPKGSAPSGSAPKGSAPKGSAPKGSAPKGSAPKGSALAVLAKPLAVPAARSRLLTSTVTPSLSPPLRTAARRRASG